METEPILLAYSLQLAELANNTDAIVQAENNIADHLQLDPRDTEQGLSETASTRIDAFLHAYLGVPIRDKPHVSMNHKVDRVALATAAYLQTYSGHWGLKASSEDALLSILSWLWPDDWQANADGIYKLRATPVLCDLSTWMWEELECAGLEAREIAEGILPKLDAVLGERAE
jgi:hypothetical protein